MQTPGQYLRQCRWEKGLSQGKLGAMLKINSQAISNWERGVAPIPVARLKALCVLVGLQKGTILRLLTREYEKSIVEALDYKHRRHNVEE